MPRLVIVGKHGYIASALCRWLDRESIAYTAISSAECDFEHAEMVERCFARFGSEELQVVFTAAINPWRDNSPDSYERNRRIVSNFVTAARRTNLRRLIYLSTVDVYGRRPALPITEASPLRPECWYGRAKCECEAIIRGGEDSGTHLTILRLPGIYGPGTNDRSVVGKLVREISGKSEVILQGGGKARRDFVCIDDLCAIVDHLLNGAQAGTYNVATGRSLPIREIATHVGEALGTPFRIIEGPPNHDRDFDLVFDNSLLCSELPGFQFTSLEHGIRAYATTLAAL